MKTTISDFLKSKKFPGVVIFARIHGSWSYNLNKEGSDIDFSGVYVSDTREILGTNPPTDTFVNPKNQKPDFAFHELGKFCRLLAKGNPTAIEMLFTDHYFSHAPAWNRLVEIRNELLSMVSINQYIGFAVSQLGRLENGQYLHTTGGAFNEKWAYHCIRLLQDALSIKSGRGVQVWKEGKERDFLLSIRNGKFNKEEIIKIGRQILTELNNTVPNIPQEPNLDLLSRTLVDMRIDFLHDRA